MFEYVVVCVADFAARTVEVQPLEDLLDAWIHVFWCVERKTLLVLALPFDKRPHAYLAVKPVAEAALHRVRFHDRLTNSTAENVQGRS
jgi:hypothetical protein